MAWLSQIGLLTFVVTIGVTGVRLLVRSLATRELPERALGCAFLLGGPIGYGPLVFVWSGGIDGPPAVWLQAVGSLGLDLAAVSLFVFNARVFRPGKVGVQSAIVVCCLLMGASWVGLLLLGGFESYAFQHPLWLFDCSVRACAYVWTTVEAFHAFRRTRRQLRVGLADAVIADRFALWGTSNAAICAIFGNFVYGQLLLGGPPPTSWYLTDAGLALAASASIWLAFFPPRAYLRWRRSARVAPDPGAA